MDINSLTPMPPYFLINIGKEEQQEKKEKISTGGDNDATPGFFYTYTDIQNVRRYPEVLTLKEDVVIQEKIHGSSALRLLAIKRCG